MIYNMKLVYMVTIFVILILMNKQVFGKPYESDEHQLGSRETVDRSVRKSEKCAGRGESCSGGRKCCSKRSCEYIGFGPVVIYYCS
ncbi:unnamed protein product [Adineta ricciae]|uniref:Uncharacterized protein n=1 Tax=Adineta ricciae TaxID=249248 RepID=A0A816EJX2_ADIRI|nr:unnamed protein product [Adineta ricciae]